MDLPKGGKINLQLQEIADPRSLSWLEKVSAQLNGILGVVKTIKIEFPKVYRVQGHVDVDSVTSLPPVDIANIDELKDTLLTVGNMMSQLQQSTVRSIQSIKFPETTEVAVNNKVRIADWSDLLDAMEELKKGFNLLLNKDFSTGKDGISQVELVNFKQLIPQPVTNFNVNPLRGIPLATAISVSTGVVPLPASPLSHRRTLMVYNNSDTDTIYLGGSAVDITNGFPIGPGTFSPAIDAGPNMLVYAVASTACDVRVLEVSNDDRGSD